MSVTLEAPAKVNLILRILAREASGFHSLESLFCALDLCDTVTVEAGGTGLRLREEGGVEMGPPERNLAVRAVRRLLDELGRDDGMHVTLRKRIPSAAGLGGGSSDAAAALRAANRIFGDPLGRDRLLQLACELGSDVPFFLGGSPLALGWGRGERLLALPPLPPARVLVAHPGQPMSTAEAFASLARRRGSDLPIARCYRVQDLSSWQGVAEVAANDFEAVAVEAVPRVTGALEALRDAGAIIALLAGSGSSVFGVFPEDRELTPLEDTLRELGFRTWRARTLERMPEPG